MSNHTILPIAVAIICTFVFILSVGIIFSNQSIPDNEKTFEVIDVRTYSHPRGLFATSDDGYIIKYLDGGEVCSLKISSNELTVRPTDNESYLIRKQTHVPISNYRYDLYLNRFYWVD